MSVECLGLADFLLIAEAITGTQVEALARQPGLHKAEHALSAPNAGIGQSEYYPRFADKAAAMAFQLIKGHPLVDGNKRVGYACLLEFVYRNGYDWSPPPGDGTERTETVATIEGVAAGTVSHHASCAGFAVQARPIAVRVHRVTFGPRPSAAGADGQSAV